MDAEYAYLARQVSAKLAASTPRPCSGAAAAVYIPYIPALGPEGATALMQR